MSSADETKTPHRAVPLVSPLLTGARMLGHGVLAIESRTTRGIDLLTFSDVIRYFIEDRPAESGHLGRRPATAAQDWGRSIRPLSPVLP